MPKRTGLGISFYAILIAIGVPFGLLACGRSGLSPGDDDPCGHAVPIKAIAPGACVLTTAGDIRCRDYGFLLLDFELHDGGWTVVDKAPGLQEIAPQQPEVLLLAENGRRHPDDVSRVVILMGLLPA
jgi:hypothetical protein